MARSSLYMALTPEDVMNRAERIAIAELLEALEFARSQDATILHMDLLYGESTEDNLGALIDNAVAAWRRST